MGVTGDEQMTSIGFRCPQCNRNWPLSFPLSCRADGCEGELGLRGKQGVPARQTGPAGSGTHWWLLDQLSEQATTLAPAARRDTPLFEANSLSERLGCRLTLKQEYAHPSGSIKDRAGSTAIAGALAEGHDTVVVATTGNMGAAIAWYANRANLEAWVFLPTSASKAKCRRLRNEATTVVQVDGCFEACLETSQRVGDHFGWRHCNSTTNLSTRLGARTLGHELARNNTSLDWVAMAVGNGSTLAACWRGFKEAKDLGWIERCPRLLGVQSTAMDPIVAAYRDRTPTMEGTNASGINVDAPEDLDRACRAVTESGGTMLAVTDGAIERAQAALSTPLPSRPELAAATPVAGIRAARNQGILPEGAAVTAIISGTERPVQSPAEGDDTGIIEIDPDATIKEVTQGWPGR